MALNLKTRSMRFNCPEHWTTHHHLECVDCMAMPTVTGTSATDYKIEEIGCRQLTTPYLRRWAETQWRDWVLADGHREK